MKSLEPAGNCLMTFPTASNQVLLVSELPTLPLLRFTPCRID